ncbi:MAG TPA: hypothetical protein VH561_17030 [Micromonosporaceae bacterium]
MTQAQRPGMAAWRTYLELATGLGDTSRKQARKVLKDLVGKGNATAEQLRALTGDLLAASSSNREALVRIVKVEVDRALGRIGLATMDEVNELTAQVRDLQRQLREARSTPAAPSTTRTASASPVVKKATRKAATATPATASRATKAVKAPATRATKATPAKATPARATATKAAAAKAVRATATRRSQ